MSTDWQNWCRLCAKHEGNDIDVFFKLESVESVTELSQLVHKYFMISIQPQDESPTTICNECYSFVGKLERFAVRCVKVDKMFAELIFDKSNILDSEIDSVRCKYGLDEEDKYRVNHDATIYKINQSTDTLDLMPSSYGLMPPPNIVKKENEDYLPIPQQQLQPPSPPVTRKRRTRSSKKNKLVAPMCNVEIKEEIDSQYEAPDISVSAVDNHPNTGDEDDDAMGDCNDTDNDLDIAEMEQELTALDDSDDTSDDDESPKRKGKGRKGKGKGKKRGRKETIAEPISCPECEKTFNSRRAYNTHIRTKHETTLALPYACSQCPKRFSTERKVQIHEGSHLPPDLRMVHPCPFCDKKFSKSVNVQAHIRAIHIGDRPFICEECGKSFATKGALKEHQITHSEERPFQCRYCPKKFKNMPRLKTHEDIHNNTTYVCPHCGLQLNTKRTLQMHMVVHSDHKKYKCHYCGNEYKRSKALKNHLILHTGLRPYTCPFCDKTFANGSNCRSHKKKAHPEELAALEASGEVQRTANIPKLEFLMPKVTPETLESMKNALALVPKLESVESMRTISMAESPNSQQSTQIQQQVHPNILPNIISSPSPQHSDMSSHQIQSPPPPPSSTPDSSQMSLSLSQMSVQEQEHHLQHQQQQQQQILAAANGMPALMAAANMLPTDPALLMQLQRAGSVSSLLSTSTL